MPSGNIADNGALFFSRTDIFTTANVISGSGTVAHTGSGTNLLSGMNTYSGTTLISGGMVVITNAGTPPLSPSVPQSLSPCLSNP